MAEVHFRNQAEIVSWHHRNCGRQQQLFVEMERPGYDNLVAKEEGTEEMWNGTKECVERMVGEAHLLRDKLEGRLVPSLAGNSNGASMASAIISEEKERMRQAADEFEGTCYDSTAYRMSEKDKKEEPRKPGLVEEVKAGNSRTDAKGKVFPCWLHGEVPRAMSRATIAKSLSAKNWAQWMEVRKATKTGASAGTSGTSVSARSKCGACLSDGATTSTSVTMKQRVKQKGTRGADAATSEGVGKVAGRHGGCRL